MTWCSKFKQAVNIHDIKIHPSGWYFHDQKIEFCPWCKATLTLEDL